MSQTTPSVLLKIFSGRHAGAEMVLSPGDWSMGSDLACDVILADAGVEREHALLSVGTTGEVRLSSLHGSAVRIGNAPVPDGGMELPWYTLFTLGSAMICIGPAEEAWPGDVPLLPAPEPSGLPDDTPSHGAPLEETSSVAPLADAPRSPELSTAQAACRTDSPVDGEVVSPPSRFRRLLSDGALRTRLIVVFVLLLVLITGTSGLRFFSSSTPEEQAGRVRQMLRAEGFATLRVLRTPQGTLQIVGVVPLPADKIRLEAVLASAGSETPPGMELRVTVADTLARELRATFERAGARLRVDRIGVGLRISGYIYDAGHLNDLLAAHEDALDEISLKLHTVFWQALEPELKKLTVAYRLQDSVHFEPAPSFVRVRAPRISTVKQAALARLEAEVTDLAQGVSPFEHAEGQSVPVSVSHSVPRREVAVPLCRQLRFSPGIRGSAATLRLDDRTYGEGGRLPGGYRISELAPAYAVLVRDDNDILVCRKQLQQSGE